MDEKVAATQRNKQQELQMKHNLDMIKQADKEENIRRIARMKEYHRQQILERIMSENEKSERIKYDLHNNKLIINSFIWKNGAPKLDGDPPKDEKRDGSQ